jgi:hypothetical protein
VQHISFVFDIACIAALMYKSECTVGIDVHIDLIQS